MGVLPTLGAAAFDQAMDIMNLEVPLVTYASQLMNHTANYTNCTEFYTALGFTADQQVGLCNNMIFGNIDFNLHYYILGMYYYQDQFNGLVYDYFLMNANMTSAELMNTLTTGPLNTLVKTVTNEVYAFY